MEKVKYPVITQPEDGAEIDVKRFKLYGFTVKVQCKNCKNILEIDHDGCDYFSYPQINTPINLDFYCDDCSTETSIKVKINISVDFVE